jgi:tetratricopeptide (TPR) repeat protein
MLEETAVQNGRTGGKSRFVLGFIAASTLWVILTLVVVGYWKTPDYRAPSVSGALHPAVAGSSPIVHDAPTVRQSVAALVAQRLAALHVPTSKAILPSDLALQADMAIKKGDFATANRIASDVLSRSKLSGWRFYPFDRFMETLVGAGNDSQLEWQLHKWREQDPNSAFAHLISARYYYVTGWATRSDDVDSEIPPKDKALFADDIATAGSEVRSAIALNPHVPWSYQLLVRVLASFGNSDQLEAAFQQAIDAYPGYYPPYRQRLYMLTPKWGGSIAAMYAFVDRYAGHAPAGSPLKLLYLQLYGYLADAASTDCAWHGDGSDTCMQSEMSRNVSPQMGDDLLQALRLYKVSDPVEYSNALWPILDYIVSMQGSNDWSGLGAVLEMAGKVMGSDEQLMDRPGHNNYVLDDITARIWAQMDNNPNVEQKFAEALSDIERTTFPDEAQKDEALATVYDHMASVAESSRQYVNIIAYQAAANAVGGSNHSDAPYETCYGYFALNLFEQAVTECTRLIDGNDNYAESHYWRALSYEQMHDWDQALADFEPIADGASNWLRVGSAIEMSVIYGARHDFAGQLASMNSHPYLFDPALQSHDDLAIAFNNRCYAYMQLGQLHEALADCTTSLKYGHIPDAYHKQLELMARLGIKPTL